MEVPHPHGIMEGCEASSVLHIHKPRLSCVGVAVCPALLRGATVVPAYTNRRQADRQDDPG
jgi:hypothetical protein